MPPKFTIEKVVGEKEAGSIIAMAFNEFGKLLISEERGPLKLVDLNQRPGSEGRIKVLCDKVNTCQGILPLNGAIFVTGKGPKGLALYKLTDRDRDESYETIEKVLGFSGELGEHGPHGLVLGADGMIYITIGNASGIAKKSDANSPFKHPYDADLIPRFEDPGGHAVGIKAPGGTIVRVSVDGSKVQTVAGGIRNAYDLVFDAQGDLLAHDSDMESDMGMSWYRPTTIFHVFDGADLGWRSGWSKYPDYYLDQAPAAAQTGRGSPSGAVLYQHLAFPAKYHDAVFFADWSEGRILVMRPQQEGASVKGKAEVFLSGKPLNVVDLDVGEDGGLYFCTGGRGTAGGVYRVKWNGKIPDSVLTFENDLARVIRHPQPSAAWARQNIAKLRQKLGKEWGPAMQGIALEKGNTSRFRTRALDNLVLYGPTPDSKFLNRLSKDADLLVRSKVAVVAGLKKNPENIAMLRDMLQDAEPRVRRCACESLIRLGAQVPFEELATLLTSLDRVENSVARRMLERSNPETWRNTVLESKDVRTFIQGSMSLMVAYPTLDNAYQVLAKSSEYMDGYVNDRDFVDLLRVIEMALAQGRVDSMNVPAFVERMKNEFPSQSPVINRELSRILANLKATGFDGRLTEYLTSNSEDEQLDRVHVAMQLQAVGNTLIHEERLALIDFLEKARDFDGGGSYRQYIEIAVTKLVQTMPLQKVGSIYENASKWPNAMVASFHILPRLLDVETVDLITTADQEIASQEDPKFKQVRLGIIAVLARSGSPVAMDYLRKLWREEPDRRGDIAIGLSQQPSGENWAYLVSSLGFLDDKTAGEVLQKLASVNRRPRDPSHYRQVITLGYRLREEGAIQAASLLQHWAGEKILVDSSKWKDAMVNCTQWFEQKWPEEPRIVIRQASKAGRYSVDDLLGYIEVNRSGVDLAHGQQIFQRAQCANCHPFAGMGKPNGPDLTSVTSRFSRREIAESILHPSRVIPDQYESKTILTIDGETLSGLAIKEAAGAYSIVAPDGKRIRVAADDIESIKDSKVSGMPANLLDKFTLKDIADLFAYLEKGNQTRTAKR